MNRSTAFLGLVLSLAAGVLMSVSAAEFPGQLMPAEKSISTWLNGLKGKSPTQVETELGPPAEKATWSFVGTNPPLLRYKTPGGGKLEIYFAGGKAVNLSYHLMSH